MAVLPHSYRYERKFLVPASAWSTVESRIKLNPGLFLPLYHPRVVNNIYLDSPALRLYFLNVDGATDRTKVRIRWYGELLGRLPRPILEFKLKSGLLGRKESFALKSFSLDENFTGEVLQRALAESDLPAPIRRSLDGLEPALLNCYHRRYFQSVDRRYRVTWDSGLEFFRLRDGHNSLLCQAAPCPHQVLELKYDQEHAADAEIISTAFPFRVTKMSKYVFGVDSLDGY